MKGFSRFAVSCALFAAVCGDWATAASRDPQPVPWAEVRSEIAAYICVTQEILPEGDTAYSFNMGDNDRCQPDPYPGRPLSRAVRDVLTAARPFLIGISPEEVDIPQEAALPLSERSVALQEALFRCDIFLRPIVKRMESALARVGLRCDDIPILEPKPVRHINWDEFSGYVAAYAWPDEVHSQVDSSGIRSSTEWYQLHTCSGINGISQTIDRPDSFLTYASFTVIFNDKFMNRAGRLFSAVIKKDSLSALADDTLRTAYLRQRLSTLIKRDTKIKKIVAKQLKKYEDDLFLILD